jgi:asparagine synthetase B (glutamine-hydrolysing)
MNVVLAIAGKQHPLDNTRVSSCGRVAARCLPFRDLAYRSERWISPSKRIALLAFQVGPPNITAQAAIHCPNQERRQAFSVSGCMRCGWRNGGLKFPAGRNDLASFVRQFTAIGGLYAAFYADDDLGVLLAVNNLTRIEPVYWAEATNEVVVGTRALAVHLVTGNRSTPQYNLANLASFINIGFFADETTPFEGVNVLPPNSTLCVSDGRVRVSRIDDILDASVSVGPDARFYDQLAEVFAQSFTGLRNAGAGVDVALTGGKDSRLVLAGLKAAGVPCSTFTASRGQTNRSDVVAAGEVARRLGLDHRVIHGSPKNEGQSRPVKVDLLQRTRDTLFVSDGMLSSYENVPKLSYFRKGIRFAGSGGELLRGGYAKSVVSPDYSKVKPFLESTFLASRRCLRRKYIAPFSAFINEWASTYSGRLSGAAVLDRFYLYYRCGRWSAAARGGYTAFQEFAQPFFDALLIRLVQGVDVGFRLKDGLIHELLRRLAPELADLPFANDYWKFSSKEEKDRWRARYPDFYIPKQPTSGAGNADWRLTYATQLRNEFTQQVFRGRAADSLFQLVRRRKLKKLFGSTTLRERKYMSFLFNLYSASVLLSNDWYEGVAPGRPIEIDPNDV